MTKKKRELANWTTVSNQTSEMGRSSIWIMCECGCQVMVYVWSFGGCGRICPGCKKLLHHSKGDWK